MLEKSSIIQEKCYRTHYVFRNREAAFWADKGCAYDDVRQVIRGEGCVPHMLNVGQGKRLGRFDKHVDDELSFVAVEREEGFEKRAKKRAVFSLALYRSDTAPKADVSGADAR